MTAFSIPLTPKSYSLQLRCFVITLLQQLYKRALAILDFMERRHHENVVYTLGTLVNYRGGPGNTSRSN
jgi:hypothetical protein